MDIKKTIDAIRRIEESKEFKHRNPDALKRKDELDEAISKYIWE